MSTQNFRPRGSERDTLDIPASDAPDRGHGTDEFSKLFGSEKCMFCDRRRTPAELEDCEKRGPGRVGCRTGGERE